MKSILKKIAFIFLAILGFNSCSDFDEINENPNAFTSDEVSAKFFMTELQIQLYAPNRYPYWRAQLIHADRYAGHFTFGFNGSWWTDALGYDYNSGYTDAAYDWMSGYLGKLSGFINFVKEGGDLQNDKFYAIGLIMKGLYYQMYVDTFGMAPYTEAFDPDNITPKYDELSTIYQGTIADLDEAMAIIGDAEVSGEGVELLTNNDLFFGGDMQKWKKLANTLKLRMALRAQGANGATFAEGAIAEALAAPLLTASDENALMEKDPDISQWANAAYGDVWWNFGTGSNWNVGKTLIDYLRNHNDPRLSYYAKPIDGGDVVLTQDAEGDSRNLFSKHSAFILQQLDDAGVTYSSTSGTKTVDGVTIDTVGISIAAGDYYVGQPTRLNGFIYSQVKEQLFSRPADIVINPKNQGKEIFPEVVMTAAEGNFLQAEAIVKGLASGDAQSLYQEGIRQAMAMWDVPEGDISTFLGTEDMAQLNGSVDENLEKIAIQRWIVSYTDGFEAWAIVRDTGYPTELSEGVSDFDIYAAGTTLNGAYPQRMRYGNGAYNTNGDNTNAALQVQGPDVQGTKLWWAK
ncbi:SusD/RagB family nutrient-binding outer membrane lipoprotein [Arenibacter palladensis]|uniref:SusD/RagB family nutrient-binding outer membrane lipoprotein n=1 Tax=Arenibacter palladensis TaxID=237373 RepID=UPI0026E4962D|nr:SusD/RagB family nutrient-binding outer membrane lipoprotein [Arenibacter palladensis]MDO6603557.1 SusD/RagB family nutrient-binding outer membrane lipoprotein [Arenibacter palladensis]